MEPSDAQWRKSSFSGSETACIEINFTAPSPSVNIRDSKNPGGGVLCADLAGLLTFARREVTG